MQMVQIDATLPGGIDDELIRLKCYVQACPTRGYCWEESFFRSRWYQWRQARHPEVFQYCYLTFQFNTIFVCRFCLIAVLSY